MKPKCEKSGTDSVPTMGATSKYDEGTVQIFVQQHSVVIKHKLAKNALDVDAETAQLMSIVENYRRAYEAVVQAQYAGGPLSDDGLGLQMFLQSFTISPGVLYPQSAPAIQRTTNGDIHRSTDGSTKFKYKKLKCLARKAEL